MDKSRYNTDMEQKHRKGEAGFTLIEMIIAVGLFAIVILVCIGALLALTNANRKAQALQSVMNNLNIALDGIVRSIREGSRYHCGDNGILTSPANCPDGDTSFAFQPFGNGDEDDPWTISYEHDADGVGRIYRSIEGQTPIPITAPEVSIDDMQFYVVGTTPGDFQQPKVVIVVKGSAGVEGSVARTTFHIQATAVQRLLDL